MDDHLDVTRWGGGRYDHLGATRWLANTTTSTCRGGWRVAADHLEMRWVSMTVVVGIDMSTSVRKSTKMVLSWKTMW
jgi:hypothetical protein